MLRRPVHVPQQFAARSTINGDMVVALFWLVLFDFQLVRSMRIDAFEMTQTRLDIIGYWIAFAIAAILGLRMLNFGRMLLAPVMLVIFLILYMTLVRLLTAPEQSPIAFLVSRFGLMMWFVLGVGFAEILHILHSSQKSPMARRNRQTILVFCGLMAIPIFSFAQEIINSPVSTLSYQAVAHSATILLLVFACILIVVYGKNLPIWLATIYMFMATLLIIAVALLQSTLIVALWLGLMVVLFGQKFRDSRLVGKMTITLFLLVGLSVFAQTAVFERLISTTRFAVFFDSGGEFTSVTSRLRILSTFADQWSVSPVFGHFQAEIVTGNGQGNYIHSLPLSLMTHSGMIGFGLTTTTLLILLRARFDMNNHLDPSEPRIAQLMWIVLGLGTISAFVTWPVFWFMLGVLCRKPAKIT